MAVGEEGFPVHRDLLMGVAYRVLGRVADAEDVVQEAWLRWAGTDAAAVKDPEAFLVTVTTRLAIDRLRRARAARESYVGEWLPEPVPTSDDPAENVVRHESVSLALLVVLETLSPLERAVFVLREVFEIPYAEVAAALDKSEAAVRQVFSRAQKHVRERRTRFEVDPGAWRQVTDQFIEVCLNGDLEGLLGMLAPDVRLIADSGGKTVAPRRAITGPEHVARFLLRVMRLRPSFLRSAGIEENAQIDTQLVSTNGGPALVLSTGGRAFVHFQLEVQDGRITTCYLIVNPEKLRGLMSQDGWVLRP